MAFSLMNGLSSAGTAVAATAGAYTLEAQKAEAEMEKVKLVDQLAGVREEKGRAFTTSEREASQAFTGGENKETRANAVAIANIGADAAIKGHQISAGATLGAATMQAASVDKQIAAHTSDLEKTLAQNNPLITADVLSKTIRNNSELAVANARKELDAATASGDPAAMQAAKLRVYNAEYSGKDEVAKVSLLQAQAKLIETALSQAQTRLVQLQDPMKSQSPGAKEQADLLTKQVDRLTGEFNTAVRTANEAVRGLPAYTPPGTTGGTAPDLNKYLRVPAPPGGLTNSPPQ